MQYSVCSVAYKNAKIISQQKFHSHRMAKICSYAKQSLHSANLKHYSNISRGISHLLSDLFISSKDSLNSPKSSQE